MEQANPDLKVNTEQMLAEERALLGLEGQQASALCLSGGGVRSAAFCLGVLQALGARQLLHHFQYLSTVSGGGYIGSFLRRVIAQANEQKTPPSGLRELLVKVLGAPASEELKALRRNTSFLAPEPGLASLDTWAGAVLWFRNTLITWMVFLPLLLAGAAVAVAYASLACLLAALARFGDGGLLSALIAGSFGVVGLVGLGYEIFHTCLLLPSHHHPDGDETQSADTQASQRGAAQQLIRHRILWPVWLWVFLAPLAAAPLIQPPASVATAQTALFTSPTAPPPCPAGVVCHSETAAAPAAPDPAPEGRPSLPWQLAFLLPACAFLVVLLAFELARRHVADPALYKQGAADARVRECNRTSHNEAFKRNYGAWIASALLAAGFQAFGVWLVRDLGALWMVLLAPLWMVTSEVLRSTFYVALRRGALRSDLDREWLARLNAAKLQLVLVLVIGAAAVLGLPILVLYRFDAVWSWLATTAGLLTGPVAAMVANSVRTAFAPASSAGSRSRLSLQSLLTAIALVFAASLAMLAGYADSRLVARFTSETDSTVTQYLVLTVAALGLVGVATAVAVLIDRVVNLNRFSMHAVYRNRLVRGFLGSARPGARAPDLFTQFDPNDNVRLAECWGPDWRRRLFPVINVALNTTVGQDAAHAERKAKPFTMTPLRCGSAELGESGAFIRTAGYAGADRETGPHDQQGGITLGTAMTISGAAVSPNMGYNSSPALAFLMTLFNVRLGSWLPNPAMASLDARAAMQSGPRYGLATLLSELAGKASDKSDFVYLSDGGHFDNLGLYEMLRRRCGLILVVDAGQDQHYAYSDLGHALQRTLIDFGVSVTLIQSLSTGAAALSPSGAYADIVYPAKGPLPQQMGRLVYLKPWLPDGMPTELKVFKALKESFPHESTVDQFFTESDFESYRRLGEYLGEGLISASLASHGPVTRLWETGEVD